MEILKSRAFLFFIFSLILWIDNSHMVQHWKSKNTINVTPVAVFASFCWVSLCTSIKSCQVSGPKMCHQFIFPTSYCKSASFPSVLPAQDITDLWFLANMIGKTCYLNVVLIYISVMGLNPFYVQELCFSFSLSLLLIFLLVWSFSYQFGEIL